jgi:hypothetical protein
MSEPVGPFYREKEDEELLVDLRVGLHVRGVTENPSWGDSDVAKALGEIDRLRARLKTAGEVL